MGIEEIKLKLSESVYEGNVYTNIANDITYLLAIIERQNKALSDAKEALDNQYRFNGGIIENNKAYMAIFNGISILKL